VNALDGPAHRVVTCACNGQLVPLGLAQEARDISEDLLTALRIVAEIMEEDAKYSGSGFPHTAALETVRAAIARAEGRSEP
jgi:hypothetical protein